MGTTDGGESSNWRQTPEHINQVLGIHVSNNHRGTQEAIQRRHPTVNTATLRVRTNLETSLVSLATLTPPRQQILPTPKRRGVEPIASPQRLCRNRRKPGDG